MDDSYLEVHQDSKNSQFSRQCWVCLAMDEEDEPNTEWIHPCRCSGTAKWVHHHCLQQWIDERQKYDSFVNVSCNQCKTEYVMLLPSTGSFFSLLESCDKILYSVSPFALFACIVGSVYWSAFCYGSFTIMQILGKEHAKILFKKSSPMIILVGIPSIPAILILAKLIPWQEQIIKLTLRNDFRFPLLGYILGKPAKNIYKSNERNLISRDAMSDPNSFSRTFCGALLLPTAATFCGNLFFKNIKSDLYRAMAGGLTFILTKGFLKILLRQRQYIIQTHKKILNFYPL